MGVEIIPGFSGNEILYDGDGNGGESERVIGVRTGDFGIGKDGSQTSNFMPGCDIMAK